jgi:hypothetical protein
MDWPIVEVVIGLAFLFFLLSVIASAVNEAIAGVMKFRAKTLEKGIKNLLTGSTNPSQGGQQLVDELYTNTLVNGYGKDEDKPSYLSSRSFRNALLEITGLLEATSRTSDDPLQAEAIRDEVQGKIDAIQSENLKRALNTIWLSAYRDTTEFRAGVERWFDRGMERVSGWYKRRVQIFLFVIGVVLTVGLNASALTAADGLWRDDGLRKGLVAQAQRQPQATSGTGALGQLEDLNFPIGWEDANRPGTVGGWLLSGFGWVLTALAIMLGAPFWFDVLGKVSNLRAAGVKPETASNPGQSTGGGGMAAPPMGRHDR